MDMKNTLRALCEAETLSINGVTYRGLPQLQKRLHVRQPQAVHTGQTLGRQTEQQRQRRSRAVHRSARCGHGHLRPQ